MGIARRHGRESLRIPPSPWCRLPSHGGITPSQPLVSVRRTDHTPSLRSQTLQKYTREYLFEKFRAEVQPVPPVAVRPSQQPAAVTRLPPLRGSRPILAIDTAPSHANGSGNGHLSMPRSSIVNGESLSAQVMSAVALQDLSPKTAASSSQSSYLLVVSCVSVAVMFSAYA